MSSARLRIQGCCDTSRDGADINYLASALTLLTGNHKTEARAIGTALPEKC